MIIVDASVRATALLDDGPSGDRAREHAGLLDAVLVTAGARLSRAPGIRCAVEVLG
ncbi:hypothetical protein [Agrococcus sp. KRD186]|uniref:hypothetical protein n=1 Tax=Agrococcus sp. KRD186 TaxID=2729730 RepID=UPI0019D0CEA3|nr:hypothetical protein [Agrococcus sp. KRD186]